MQPTTKLEAWGMVTALTTACTLYMDQVFGTTGRKQRVALARFREVNETRCRLIDEWGLHEAAAALIAE